MRRRPVERHRPTSFMWGESATQQALRARDPVHLAGRRRVTAASGAMRPWRTAPCDRLHFAARVPVTVDGTKHSLLPGTRSPHAPGRVSQNDAPFGSRALPSTAGSVTTITATAVGIADRRAIPTGRASWTGETYPAFCIGPGHRLRAHDRRSRPEARVSLVHGCPRTGGPRPLWRQDSGPHSGGIGTHPPRPFSAPTG